MLLMSRRIIRIAWATVIKQRMQVHNAAYRTFLSTASQIYRSEGLRAFYLSYPTTLVMSIPFTAVQFSTYEWVKKVTNPTGVYSPWTHVMAGGVAGAVAAALTTPLDVAKTLLQTRGTSSDPEIRKASGMVQAFRIIWQREGMKGFSRGLRPRVLTFMPSNALCFLVRLWSQPFFFLAPLFVLALVLLALVANLGWSRLQKNMTTD